MSPDLLDRERATIKWPASSPTEVDTSKLRVFLSNGSRGTSPAGLDQEDAGADGKIAGLLTILVGNPAYPSLWEQDVAPWSEPITWFGNYAAPTSAFGSQSRHVLSNAYAPFPIDQIEMEPNVVGEAGPDRQDRTSMLMRLGLSDYIEKALVSRISPKITGASGTISAPSIGLIVRGVRTGASLDDLLLTESDAAAAGPSPPQFPRLAAAVHEGRVVGVGLPSPGVRSLRLIEADPDPATEDEQIGFGRSGRRPDDAPRRPRLR